jgi:hypothetical protein
MWLLPLLLSVRAFIELPKCYGSPITVNRGRWLLSETR